MNKHLTYHTAHILIFASIVSIILFSISVEAQITTHIPSFDEADIAADLKNCEYTWNCTDWSVCVNRKQTRTCNNIGNCPGTFRLPSNEKRCLPKLPKQLFDVKLELERDTIFTQNPLTSWVIFESFGTEPTPVNLTYIILNESGDEIYSEIDSITVYTEEFLIKTFNAQLTPGKYSLKFKLQYANNVTEEFRKKFTVTTHISSTFVWLIIVGIAVISILLFSNKKMSETANKKSNKQKKRRSKK